MASMHEERIDDSEGRGARKECFVPKPFGVALLRRFLCAFVGGRSVAVELVDGTNVFEEREVDERHLNDSSE